MPKRKFSSPVPPHNAMRPKHSIVSPVRARVQLSASYRKLLLQSRSRARKRRAPKERAIAEVECNSDAFLYSTSDSETGGLLALICDEQLSFDHLKHLILHQRDSILKLGTSEADSFMSILQDNVDKMPVDDAYRGAFIDTLLQLAIVTSVIPRCLDLTGITDRVDEPITTGGFGDVYRARWKDRTVALKKLRETGGIDKSKLHRNLCKEVLLWRQLRHSNILEFLGICKDVFSSPAIVSPWMVNGSVMQFVEACDLSNRKQLVYRLLSQVAHALDYLHGQTPVIVHQDVRCANILVNDANEAVLSDFGLSRLDSNYFNTFTSSLEHGCLRWQAPELLFPDTQLTPDSGQSEVEGEDPPASLPNPTPASDVYALGMTALELITRKKPFSSVVLDAAVVLEIYYNRKPDHGRRVDVEMWPFLLTCWSKNPSDRPRASDASEFFSDAAVNHELWHPPGQLFLRRLPQREETSLEVPKELFSAVAGKDRCNFSQLEKGYQVTITYSSSEGRRSNDVVINGYGVRSAMAEITKLVELHQTFGHMF